MNLIEVVAHRGDTRFAKQNTAEALRSAFENGLRFAECDVQFSANNVPFLCHDTRQAALENPITHSSSQEIIRRTMLEPLSFMPPILAAADDDVRLFVEVKPDSIAARGLGDVMRGLDIALGTQYRKCIPISFDPEFVRLAAATIVEDVGLVINDIYEGMEHVERIQPEYVFVRAELVKLFPERLPVGPWRWVVYGVKTVSEAIEMIGAGASLVESDRAIELLKEMGLDVK